MSAPGPFSSGQAGLNQTELVAPSSPSSVHFALPRSSSPSEAWPGSRSVSYEGKSQPLSASTSIVSMSGPSRSHQAHTPSHLHVSTTPSNKPMRRARSESTAATLGGYVTTTDESETDEHAYNEPAASAAGTTVPDRRPLAPTDQSQPGLSSSPNSSSCSSGNKRLKSPPPPQPSRIPSSQYSFPQVAAPSSRPRTYSSATHSSRGMNGRESPGSTQLPFVSRDQHPVASRRQSSESSRQARLASSSAGRPTGRLSTQPSQDRISHSGSFTQQHRRTRESSYEGSKRSADSGPNSHHSQTSKSARQRDDGRSSENDGPNGPRADSLRSGSRKGKGRARDRLSRAGFEAGLNGGSLQRTDAEQLAALVSSIDINGALRIISEQKLALPQSAGTGNRTSLQPAKQPVEPYLIRAPPALIPRDFGPSNRDRADSNATQSTVATSIPSPMINRQRQVSLSQPSRQRRDSSAAMIGRARAGSQVITEVGGHVPFTHHAKQASISADESQEDAPVPEAAPPDPPIKEMIVEGAQSAVRKKGLSLLFKRKDKETLKPTRLSHTVPQEVDREREREMQRRKAVELERMELEAAQERTQATLAVLHQHPNAERAAYEARAHFQAYYNLIYDAIESHEYINPLLIIRWVHRRDQQAEARARWEAENKSRLQSQPDGMFGDTMHSSPISIPGHRDRHSVDGTRPSSEYSGRQRDHVASSVTTSQSRVSSSRPTPTRNRWKWTLDDAREFRRCKGEVDFFVPPTRHSEAKPPSSHTTSLSPLNGGFNNLNRSRDAYEGGGSSNRSMKSASTGPDMSSVGDAADSRRRMSAGTGSFGGGDLSRSVSQEQGRKLPTKLVKPTPPKHDSPDEMTDKELSNSHRYRHGHHARAIVEHLKNVIPGRHEGDRDGSASDTDRGDRSGFSPRAFTTGILPFRHTNDSTVKQDSYKVRVGNATDEEGEVNGDRAASKASSTRAKVAQAIRNRAQPKPSLEKLGRPTMIEHTSVLDSVEAIDVALDPKAAVKEAIQTPAIENTPQVVPKVLVEDEAVTELYRLRKERLAVVRRKAHAVDDVQALLDLASQQMAGQISHVQKLVEVSAGYTPQWPEFGALALLSQALPENPQDHLEATDTLGPLKHGRSVASETDSDRVWRRSEMRRRSSVQAVGAQSFLTVRPAPRRISLAPAEPIMLDPISRLAAMIDYTNQQLRDFIQSTTDTEAYQVNTRSKMKAVEVKATEKETTARAMSQEIKDLERQRIKAAREADSRVRDRLLRFADVAANFTVRAIVGRGFKTVRFFMSTPCLFGFERSIATGDWHWAPGWQLFRTACLVPVFAVVVVALLYYYGDD